MSELYVDPNEDWTCDGDMTLDDAKKLINDIVSINLGETVVLTKEELSRLYQGKVITEQSETDR